MSSASYNRQTTLGPAAVGFNAAVVADGAPVTSTILDCRGRTQFSLDLKATRVAATAWSVYVELSSDYYTDAANANWERVPTESISGGTITIADATWTITTSTSFKRRFIELPINTQALRFVVAATNGTTDAATCWVTLGTN